MEGQPGSLLRRQPLPGALELVGRERQEADVADGGREAAGEPTPSRRVATKPGGLAANSPHFVALIPTW